jgi:hypothetical protein
MTGAELARRFHRDEVAPPLRRHYPRLRYAAARLGSGSDVLGRDDVTSRDHDWGCRLTVLVDGADAAVVPQVHELLERELPERYGDHPTRFATTWDPRVTHRVEVATVTDFVRSRLGVDPLSGMSAYDWLIVTGQSVLEVTAGPVFIDGTAELGAVRRRLTWYPPDLERYVLAAAWQRLAQRMPLVGRTAMRGQELQSRLLCAGLVGDLIRIAFLVSRRWAPYDKWLEAVFRTLPVAGELADLEPAATAEDWRVREAGLAAAVEVLLRAQRELGLPTPVTAAAPFWDRPYRTVDDAVSRALLAEITDPVLTGLPRVGSIEQWVDSVDVLTDVRLRAAAAGVYRTLPG